MKTTEESNRLISAFMNDTTIEKDVFLSRGAGDLKYHSSWDWLMPVVEKINGMFHRITIEGNEEEDKCVVLCYNNEGELDHKVYECGLNLLEATYKAVIKFIEWNNTKTK